MRVAILSLILFLSGTSALLFQTLWLRLSGLAFGNSVWSAALILSSFMAGLALGSAIAASLTLQRLRPLRVYMALEVVVAVLGCTLVFTLPDLGQWLRPVFQLLWHHQQLLNGMRFAISFLILLIPTTAMGLSLPVLLEDPLLQQQAFGPNVGTLYGCNTLGAVAGALLGEAFLIKLCGLFGTGLTAGTIGCVAAAFALLFAGKDMVAGEQIPSQHRLRLSLGHQPPWSLLFVSMGAGAALLSLEVVWFRFLRLYVASTSIAFCTMLSVVLLGMGLGGLTSRAISRRPVSARKLLPFLLLLAAVGTLLCYLFFPVPVHRADAKTFNVESWQQIGWLSLVLMFPVAFVSGVLFPMVLASVQQEIPNRMNSAGLTILFNTLGAALGPMVTGFVLLPWFGFQTSLIIASVAYVGLAILATESKHWSVRQRFGQGFLALGAAFVAIVAIFPYHRAETHFANARRPYEEDSSYLLKKIEGDADTFQLLRRDLFGEPYYYRLITDAYSMSGTLPRSQRYMRLFAYLPLALRPESEDALLLCYGVGVTADALTRDSRLKHLDAVDISKEVFDLADHYSGPAYSNPVRDPRVTTFVQDGRFFLQATPKKYDIITGEPPPLKVLGTVNLYTEQFFSLVKDRLKDGGVVTFWLPLYQLTTDETKAILRAFHNVFPNTTVWSTCDLEWIMTGIKGSLSRPNEESARRLWTDEKTRVDLVRIGIEVPEQMSTLFLMDGAEIDRITQGVKPLTDLYPKRLMEVHPDLNAAFRFGYSYIERSAARHHFLSSSFINETWPKEWQNSLELYFLVRETRYISELSGSNWLAELDLYLRHTNLRAPVLAVEDSDELRLALAERRATRSQSVPTETLHDRMAGALARRDLNAAIQFLETEKERGFPNKDDFFLLIYLYCLNRNVEKAEALAASEANSIQKDKFVSWLWGDLQAEFGFRPPS